MPQPIKIRGGDKIGIIKDSPAFSLPPSAYTDGRNVRFHDGVVSKIPGEVNILGSLVNMSNNMVDPEHIAYWPNPITPQYVYINKTHVYTMNSAGGIHNINKNSAPYASSDEWHSAIFTGGYALVLNSTVGTPQYVIDTTTDGSVPDLQDLPGWTYGTTTSVTAGIIQAFNNVLIAGNITAVIDGSTVRSPGTIRISTQAPAGSIPQVWQAGPNTDTADEFELSATSPVVAMVQQQGQMICYTNDSIHAVGVTANASTARVVTTSYGALSRTSVIEFDGQHLVVGSDDIYTFGGHPGSIKSVADGKVRDDFYKNLSPLYAEKTFIVRNNRFDEIWICYPDLTSHGRCNTALIWNYRDNTWTVRDLPDCSSGVTGPINGGGLLSRRIVFSGSGTTTGPNSSITLEFLDGPSRTLSTASLTIDQIIGAIDSGISDIEGISVITDTNADIIQFVADSIPATNRVTGVGFVPDGTPIFAQLQVGETTDPERPWGTEIFNHSKQFVVLGTDGRLVATDVSYTDKDGNKYTSFIERTLMDPIGEEGVTKNILSIYPMMDGEGEITITTSLQDSWGTPVPETEREYTYDIPTDYKVDPYGSGRILNIKFSESDDKIWRLSGEDIFIEIDGHR